MWIFRIGVRFGEYDLHNEKDCVCLEIQDGICQIEDCADTIKDIRIESVKVHEEQNNHNIALIRLNTSVNYTSGYTKYLKIYSNKIWLCFK